MEQKSNSEVTRASLTEAVAEPLKRNELYGFFDFFLSV